MKRDLGVIAVYINPDAKAAIIMYNGCNYRVNNRHSPYHMICHLHNQSKANFKIDLHMQGQFSTPAFPMLTTDRRFALKEKH